MLACIACWKQRRRRRRQQLVDEEDEAARRGSTSGTKPAGKSLTSEIKDAVLKLSGALRQAKPAYPHSSSSTLYPKPRHHRRSCEVVRYQGDGDGAIDCSINGGAARGRHGGDKRYHDPKGRGGSSSSTPAWDIAGTVERGKGSRFEAGGIPVMVEEVDHGSKEWVAQVEPGVHITFLSLPHGGNSLKRIRFEEMFNKWQAQRWWGENYDRIMELYNVQRFNTQALPTTLDNGNGITSPDKNKARVPTNSVAGRVFHPAPDPTENFFPRYQQDYYSHSWGASFKGEAAAPPPVEARTISTSRDEATAASISNASDIVEATEWVEEDEPGVFVTIRQLADGTRDLRRLRFSGELFGEANAKQWWEENRERIHAVYL